MRLNNLKKMVKTDRKHVSNVVSTTFVFFEKSSRTFEGCRTLLRSGIDVDAIIVFVRSPISFLFFVLKEPESLHESLNSKFHKFFTLFSFFTNLAGRFCRPNLT